MDDNILVNISIFFYQNSTCLIASFNVEIGQGHFALSDGHVYI